MQNCNDLVIDNSSITRVNSAKYFRIIIDVKLIGLANLAFLCRNQGWVSERNRSRIAEIVAAGCDKIAVVRFSKQQSVSQRMIIRIAVCDIAANQVTEIRLYIFKYHGDIFQ